MKNNDTLLFRGKARVSFVLKTKVNNIKVRSGTLVKQYINSNTGENYLVVGRNKVLMDALLTPAQIIVVNCVPVAFTGKMSGVIR